MGKLEILAAETHGNKFVGGLESRLDGLSIGTAKCQPIAIGVRSGLGAAPANADGEGSKSDFPESFDAHQEYNLIRIAAAQISITAHVPITAHSPVNGPDASAGRRRGNG